MSPVPRNLRTSANSHRRPRLRPGGGAEGVLYSSWLHTPVLASSLTHRPNSRPWSTGWMGAMSATCWPKSGPPPGVGAAVAVPTAMTESARPNPAPTNAFRMPVTPRIKGFADKLLQAVGGFTPRRVQFWGPGGHRTLLAKESAADSFASLRDQSYREPKRRAGKTGTLALPGPPHPTQVNHAPKGADMRAALARDPGAAS